MQSVWIVVVYSLYVVYVWCVEHYWHLSIRSEWFIRQLLPYQ